MANIINLRRGARHPKCADAVFANPEVMAFFEEVYYKSSAAIAAYRTARKYKLPLDAVRIAAAYCDFFMPGVHWI